MASSSYYFRSTKSRQFSFVAGSKISVRIIPYCFVLTTIPISCSCCQCGRNLFFSFERHYKLYLFSHADNTLNELVTDKAIDIDIVSNIIRLLNKHALRVNNDEPVRTRTRINIDKVKFFHIPL